MTDFFNTGLTQQQFLEQYWQKKPLLIRKAFALPVTDFEPDDLAGLSLETEVESRLVRSLPNQQWQLQYGPFDEDFFSDLPEKNWTLLVQDVEKHLPELQTLLEPFRFMPDWRRDDLMISYAVPGGSVGPHIDSYDVFLLQTHGTRRWEINTQPDFVPDWSDQTPLPVLTNFQATECWDLQPGDMLYLPPRLAHYGVAQTQCMTFSIGFRAPSQLQLLDVLVDRLSEHDTATTLYADADLQPTPHPAQISAADIQRCKQQLHALIDDLDDCLPKALAVLMTESKVNLDTLAQDYPAETLSLEVLADRFAQGLTLQRNPYLRCVWYQQADHVWCCFAGQFHTLAGQYQEWMALCCEAWTLDQQDWQQLRDHLPVLTLLQHLIASGAWYWSD